jgi:predicted kinase
MPKLYMMVGLSGSGKSTYAKKLNAKVISSDVIRAEVFGDENDQTHNVQVFEILHKRVIECLKNGEDCVCDATNLSAKRRKGFLNSISHIGCEKICCVFATPYEICIKQNLLRERKVPTDIIKFQMKQFQMPHKYEGWDLINVIRYDFKSLPSLKYYFTFSIPHDCAPWHCESIQAHMLMAAALAEEEKAPNEVCEAILFHDIGKLYVKDFKDAKGRSSKTAHYYRHENVSAYLYLTSKEYSINYRSGDEVVYLIQFHMEPFIRKDAAWDRFAKNFSLEFLEKLALVNKYDDLGRKKGD